MGVPRLLGWVLSTFPNAVKHFQQGEFVFHTDNLYIDAPSIIHNANQQVHNYGQAKRKLDPYKSLSPEEKRTKACPFAGTVVSGSVQVRSSADPS